MTYQEAIDFLFSSLPMYQRVGKAAYKDNLENALRLDEWFGNPHLQYPTIHVAGTNGKGSVSHLIASALQASGLRTGLYTSPHLLDFRERIKINGQLIPEEEVSSFVLKNRAIIEEIKPSFFEMTVAMAFDWFARQKVDAAVIETGMGGRLDSTNIIRPVLSVITNISLDHTEFLGADIASIAREKGGIIKEGVPLVIGRSHPQSDEVLYSMARERKAPVIAADRRYVARYSTLNSDGIMQVRIGRPGEQPDIPGEQPGRPGEQSGRPGDPPWRKIPCELTGAYQHENIITALVSLEQLQELHWEISEDRILDGFSTVVRSTGILGRWQTVGTNPRSICDTAHNADGIAAVIRQIRQIPWKKLHMVWGMVNDKDPDRILPLLPREARYYFTRSSVPRSMDADSLAERAREYGLTGSTFPGVAEAYRAAQAGAGPDDLIFTGGSTFVVADLLVSKF